MRRFILLTIAYLCLFVTQVQAYDFKVDGIYYDKIGGAMEVTYKDQNYNSYSGSITIPSRINVITDEVKTYDVFYIGCYAFYDCNFLTSVTISEGVKEIRTYAFKDCSLTEVTIPNSMKRLSDWAFYNCTSLRYVVSKIKKPFTLNASAFSNISNKCVLVVPVGTRDAYIAAGWTEDVFKGGIVEVLPFADANVKALCVANWDIDGDGELNTFEAAAVMDLGRVFNNRKNITSFKELQYFTGLTSIGDEAFSGCSGLTSIDIPSNVTSIENEAFKDCSSLTSVIIPESVTSIGDYAFDNCSSLTSVIIPESVTSIGDYAFDNCSSLTSIIIPEGVTSIGNYTFQKCSSLTSIIIPEGVTSIGNYTFQKCSSLTSIIIPESVTSIGSGAFYGCSSLTSVIIPESVTSIGNSTFFGCIRLTSVIIPESVTSIGDYAFYGCSSLTSVIIPESVTSIGSGAFKGCSRLTSVTIPNSVTSIDDYTFSCCSGLYSITIPSGVTSIGNYAFDNCSGLTSVIIPEGVTSIGNYAFQKCSSLTSIIIPEGVTSIGNYAFQECSSLTSIIIPEGVTSIGIYAFQECNSMMSVTIPSSVTGIKYGTFRYCSSLASVIIQEGVTSIGNNAFQECSSLTSVTIPGSVTSIGNYAFDNCSGLTSVTISSGVTSIGNSSFYRCSGLTSVTIPGSVTNIGSSAFYGCSGLTFVTIHYGVTSIGTNAFKGCSSMTSIDIPYSLTEIEIGTFENCSGLISVTIPGSVTRIGYSAFRNCRSLTNVTIGNSVTSIGNYAFRGCSSLESVTSEIETPEVLGFVSSFFDTAKNCLLIVPVGTRDAYIAQGWDRIFTGGIVETVFITFANTNVKAICISSWDTNHDGELSQIEAAAVTDLSYKFKDKTDITSFDELQYFTGLTSIGDDAFHGCSDLTSVTIPSSVTSIGNGAFSGCSALTSIDIPSSVTSIRDHAFYGCSGLTAIKVEKRNTVYDSRNNCNAIIETASNTLIAGCRNTVIPSSVTSIGSNAFSGCSGLTSIDIPSSVTSIGSKAFEGCNGLNSVVSEIKTPIRFEVSAFDGIADDCVLTVPADTRDAYIAQGWTEDVFKGGVVETAFITFADANVKALCIANWDTTGNGELSEVEAAAVTDLGNVFKNNTTITSFNELQYFTGLTSIGSQAFYGCSGLTSFTIPAGVKSIGQSAFSKCSNLTSVVIPEGVTSIGNYAFQKCSSLTSIIIPEGVTSIGSSAFYLCSSLTSVVSKIITPFKFGSSAFSSISDNCTLTVPANTRDAYIAAGWTENVFKGGIVSMTPKITFADTSVKAICVANWDTNGDGEMNTAEAAAVTDLGNVFTNNNSITSFDELQYFTGLTNIGASAFSGCRGLTSITIPAGVTNIGDEAFTSCSSLISITIPAGVTSIKSSAFAGCNGLTSVTIPAGVINIGYGAFNDCNDLTSIQVESGNTVFDSRDNCNAIIETATNTLIVGCKNSEIPSSVTSIGEYAFKGCNNLTSITIPSNVTSIGSYAFYNCYDLTSVIISSSMTSIGNRAFCSCIGLTSISIPSCVTSIGDEAFKDCCNLTSVASDIETPFQLVTSSFNEISSNCVLTVPAGLRDTYIAAGWTEEIFKGGIVELISNITFADANVKTLCLDFWDNNGDGELSTAEAAAVTSLGYVFAHNSSITSFDELQYFTGLTSIGYYAFSNCYNLTSVTIPNGVTSIEKCAFNGCNSLTSITIPSNVTSIVIDAFKGCIGLISIQVASDNTVYDSRNNCNAIIETATNILITGCKNTVIPSSVTSIRGHAFSGCSGLTSITIPSSVTSIGDWAFQYCNRLTSIEIPSSVTSIGLGVFSGCYGITSIQVESENTVYDSRNNCNAIIETASNTLIAGCRNTVIPSSVTSIESFAFNMCIGLKSITIPSSVTSIGNGAFGHCYSLTSVVSAIETPFQNDSDVFNEIASDCVLTVPAGTREAYIAAGWTEDIFKGGVVEREIGDLTYLIVNPHFADGITGWTGDVTNVSYNSCERWNMACNIYQTVQIPNGWYRLKYKAFQRPGLEGSSTVYNDYIAGTRNSFAVMYANNVEKDLKHICDEMRTTKLNSTDYQVGNYYIPNKMEGARAYFDAGLYVDSLDVEVTDGTLTIGVRGDYLYSGQWVIFSDFELLQLNDIVENITFADANVKALCVANWDTNGDGELSEAEAAAVTDLGEVFKGNTTIQTFDELQYFTGLTSIGNSAFYGCSGLTSVTIPNCVTSIGDYTFLGCSSLTSVTIPNSVTSLGTSAFLGCSSLTTITIPNSVTSIGQSVFWNCCGLTSVNVESGNAVYDSRDNCNAIIETNTNTLIVGCLNTIIPNSVTSIGNSAFYGCSALTSVTIPNSVTGIGNFAFYGCSSLTSITIPNSVTSIGSSAFSGCSGLTSVNVESSNAVYDSRDNCNAIIETNTNTLIVGCLNTIIPNSVTSIGYDAFGSCSSLTSITIPSSVTSIGNSAFYGCSALTSVTIPNSVTSIEGFAFEDCSALTSVLAEMETPFAFGSDAFINIGSSCVLTVPYGTREAYIAAGWTEDVFKGGIIEAPVPNIDFADANVKALCVAKWDTNGDGELSETEAAAVTDLGEVFKGKTIHTFDELQYFTGLTSIGNQAFNGCSNLTSVTFPSSVTSIGESAFYDCSSLASIAIPASVESIGIYAFSGNCSSLTSIEVADGNSVYDSRENCNAIIATATNTLVAGCENTIIPASVTSIGKGAFELRTGLTSIELPEGLTNIGDYAFKGSGLTSIVISENVTSIGIETFANCNNLTSLLIPNGASVYTSSFSGCNNLKSINHWTNTSNDLYQFNTWSRENDGSGLTVPFIEVWRGAGKMLNNTTITHEPLTGLTPGNYTVTILARAYNEGNSTTNPSGFTFYANDASVALEDVGTTAVYSSEFNGLSTLVYAELSIDCEVQADGILNVGFQIENAVGDWFAFKNLEFSYNYNVEATSMVLNQETLVFTAEGQTTPLTATVAPADATDKSVTWSSSDETVATVSSDGIVTAVGEGTATITATTNDGTNLTATCTVTVNIPADEPDTDISQIDNVVYMEHTEASVGTEQTLSIRMKNSDDIQTVQFDLYLPDGVEVVLDEDDYELIELSLERTTARKMDQFSVVRTSNGAYRVLINSTRGNTFDGNDGEIVTARVNLADDMAAGDYPLIFKDIVLVNTSSVGYRTAYVKSTLTVADYTPGDVNSDKAVDAIDLNAITNYILERRTFPFTFNVKAGDINNDNMIDAIDLNAVTNMILHDSQAGAKPRAVIVGRIDN